MQESYALIYLLNSTINMINFLENCAYTILMFLYKINLILILEGDFTLFTIPTVCMQLRWLRFLWSKRYDIYNKFICIRAFYHI